jgi:hypothetical protein
MTKRASSTAMACLLVFALAASLRTGYILYFQTFQHISGGCEMERAARAFACKGAMADVYGPETGPSAHLAPLYPLLLGGIYRLFGFPGWGANLTQELLAAFTTATAIGLLPLVASRCRLRPTAGVAAGLAMALCPFNFWVETSGTWEQPFVALTLILVLLAFVALHECGWRSTRLAVLTGLLLGLAGLLNPNLLLVAGLMLAGEWLLGTGVRMRIAVRGLGIFLLALLCLAPWVARNYVVLGGLVPVRSNFGLELCMGNNPVACGLSFPDSDGAGDASAIPATALHPTDIAERERYLAMGELAYMKYKRRAATDWIAEHPGRFAWLTLRRIQLYWFPTPDAWSSDTGLRPLRALVISLIGFAAFAGLSLRFRRGDEYRWLWAAALIVPSLVYVITHINPRYSYPTLGLATVLACDFGWSLTRPVGLALSAAFHAALGRFDVRRLPTGATVKRV